MKILLFIVSFSLYFTINGFFFSDDTMNKIYESKGQFDLEDQIPIIVYSTIISALIKTLLNLLALSNDAIISYKQKKSHIFSSQNNFLIY